MSKVPNGRVSSWFLTPLTGVCALTLFFASALMSAQAPAPQAPAPTPTPAITAQPAPANRLPVRRVILYKSGVGYFEHLGRVRGNQTVTIDFTSGQLNDVLKSLTTLDLDGGRVSGVSYNSEAGLDRRLGALRLPVGQETTRAAFLSALRGARLEVRSATTRLVGRLLSVEVITSQSGGVTRQTDAVTIVTDAGEMQTVALDPGVTVRIAETDLNQEVGRYLSLVASVRDQDLRRLAIATTGTGERDLFVSYVSEVPVWKATYRLVLPAAVTGASQVTKPLLQGWAIVDNTVGEDWENVELSLVAGAPQSFIQQISQPYYVQRPVVALPERMLLSPQTHQSAVGTAGLGALAGAVTDTGGGVIPGVTVRVSRNGAAVGTAVTDQTGRYVIGGLAPGSYDVTFTLPGFRATSRPSTLVSGGMQTALDVSMPAGGINESVTVSTAMPLSRLGGGRGSGAGGGVFRAASENNMMLDGVSVADRREAATAAFQAEAAAGQLGDLFEYKLTSPVTIRKNQSALVPILSGEVVVDKVSLWNEASGAPRPLRALWLTNSTKLTLDGGSFSVVEGQAFAGEGLMDPLKVGERRLLSYAMDLGLSVDAKGETVPTRVTKVQVTRGVLIQQTEERQRRAFTARNEDTEPRVLVIEHPVRTGWILGGTLTPAESTAAVHRFRVPIAAKTTATFLVEETRPVQTQISVNAITDNQVALLVRDQVISAALEAALRQVLAQKATVARLNSDLAARQRELDQIGVDQGRVRENMRSLKGSAEEKQLLQRYVKQLDDQENRLEALRKEQQTIASEIQRAQAELTRLIEGLTV